MSHLPPFSSGPASVPGKWLDYATEAEERNCLASESDGAMKLREGAATTLPVPWPIESRTARAIRRGSASANEVKYRDRGSDAVLVFGTRAKAVASGCGHEGYGSVMSG